MREIRLSGSLSGEWKRRHGRILWHWQPKGPATRMADLNPPRHSSTLLVWGVASPLLANLYMRRFVLGWKVKGHKHRLFAQIVNYADDFVICCLPAKLKRRCL